MEEPDCCKLRHGCMARILPKVGPATSPKLAAIFVQLYRLGIFVEQVGRKYKDVYRMIHIEGAWML